MRILGYKDFVFLPAEVSGAHWSIDRLMRGLQSRGHDAGLVCATDPLPFHGNEEPSPFLPYSVFRTEHPLEDLPGLAWKFGAEVIIIFGPSGAASAIATCLGHGLPCLCHSTTASFEGIKESFGAFNGVLYSGNSLFTATKFKAWYGIECAVFPPLIDRARFSPPINAGNSILFINPSPQKGIHLTIALAALLPNRKFIVGHSWPATQQWATYIRSGAPPNIEWREVTLEPQALYAEARVLLMPSIWEEAWGRAASEGQAMGLPVLGMRRGGLEESIGPGGKLFDLGEPLGRWAQEIDMLFEDQAYYRTMSERVLGHANRSSMKEDYILSLWENRLAEAVKLECC